ncbi:cupin [Terrihabitans sp. B22-R8]|uniref:cupin n=1 Tax=Terrihabitans sp. B22-R8 TaxID=3425128 RepID=UPI00403CA4ED
MANDAREPETLFFADDGTIPNNPSLAVLVYRGVLTPGDGAAAFEDLFARNGWTGSWRNGLYDFHHFHSTAHEVLGISRGRVTARIGGPDGRSLMLEAGDVVMLPAGTGHFNEGASEDLEIVGAYADGRDPDLCRGEPKDAAKVRDNIAKLRAPERDPVRG